MPMPVSLFGWLPPSISMTETPREQSSTGSSLASLLKREKHDGGETEANILLDPIREDDVEVQISEYPNDESSDVMIRDDEEQEDSSSKKQQVTFELLPAVKLAGKGEPGDRSGNPKESMFSFPFGIAQHPNGSLYVADTENNGIKMLAANYSVVVTVAGDQHGLKTPVDVVVCPRTGNVYVSDAGHYVIHRLTPEGNLNMISGDGVSGHRESNGHQSARWDFPLAMAFDIDGELLVCDTANHCVRKIYVNEFDNRFENNKREKRQTDEDEDSDSSDNDNEEEEEGEEEKAAILSYPRTECIAGIVGVNGSRDGPLDSALLDAPTAIAVAPDGTIYVADSGCGSIRKIFADKTDMVTVPGIYAGAMGLTCDSYGRLYISHTEGGAILMYDDRDGKVSQLAVEGLYKPHGIVVDSGCGTLFVADTHRIMSVPVEKCLPPSESTFASDFSDLLAGAQHDELADITFYVENGEHPFRAHKCVIRARCPRLYAHIRDVSEHRVQDISYASFVLFMQFIYTDDVAVDGHTWDHLLVISEVYDVKRLREIVEDYAVRRINVDNVLQTLSLAHQCGAIRLKRTCMKTVLANFQTLQAQIPSHGLSECPEILTELLLAIPK